MANMNTAPTQDNLLDPGSSLPARSWFQWFSDLGTNLSGKWGTSSRRYTVEGVDKQPDEGWISYQGREMSVNLVWNDGFESINGNILLTSKDYTVIPSMLELWQGNTISFGVYAMDRTFSIPDNTYTGRIIIQGRLITKVAKAGGL